MICSTYAQARAFFRQPGTAVGGGVVGTSSVGGLVQVQTSIAHGRTTGDWVDISEIVGTGEANGFFQVTVTGANTFTIPVPYANAYISGGVVRRLLVALDGLPTWPGPQQADGTFSDRASNLRKSGWGYPTSTLVLTTQGGHVFSGGLVGINGPLLIPSELSPGDNVWPISITCNGGAADGTPFTSDFDFWVSLRREVGWYMRPDNVTPYYWSNQPLLVTQPDPLKSGTIQLALNTPAISALLPGLSGLGLATPDSLYRILQQVDCYVSRRSDRAYQFARMLAPPTPFPNVF